MNMLRAIQCSCPPAGLQRDISILPTYDSSLTLTLLTWPCGQVTLCVSCTWLNFLLHPLKLATFVLSSVHSYSLIFEHGGVRSACSVLSESVSCKDAIWYVVIKQYGPKQTARAEPVLLPCAAYFYIYNVVEFSDPEFPTLYIQLMLPDAMRNSLYLAFLIWLFCWIVALNEMIQTHWQKQYMLCSINTICKLCHNI